MDKEAAWHEEESKYLVDRTMVNQAPISMQSLVSNAEIVRKVLAWTLATSRESLSAGQVDRAAGYAVALAMTTSLALANPFEINPMCDVKALQEILESGNGGWDSLLDDPFDYLNEFVARAEGGNDGRAALEAMYRLQTFEEWEAVDCPAGPTEEALGLDRIVVTDIWLNMLSHRWPLISATFNDLTKTFVPHAPDTYATAAHRVGLHALLRSVSAICMFVMHRDPWYLKAARDNLASARAAIPAEAIRALRALDMQQAAIDDIAAGNPALIALPGATAMFETMVDPNKFAWTSLLLDDQSTHDLPVQGADVDIQALLAYVDANARLKAGLPFQIYDPRLAVWLGLGISLTWPYGLLGAFAVSLKKYELGSQLLDICFKNLKRLPSSLRASVESQAVSTLIELVRGWSAEIYGGAEDLPQAQQQVLLERARTVIGLLAEVSKNPLSVQVSALSPLSTAAIDASWKVLINQVLADPDRAPGALPPALVPALTEIRRRLLYIERGVLSNGRFAAVAPLWRFEYLFDAASFFVAQAKYAEQRALDYKDRASNMQLQRQQLLDAIEMARSELAVASRRVEEARASQRIARDNLVLAQSRKIGAIERLQVYDQNSDLIRQYQAMSASLGSGSDGVFSSIQGYVDAMRREGRATGPVGYLIGANTYLAASLAGEVERAALESQRAEAALAETLAQDQVAAEAVRKDIADAYSEQASRRLLAAQRMLEGFDDNASSVSQGDLAAFMQRIAEAYFNMAVDAALSAQSAFNYQYRTQTELISGEARPVAERGIMASEDLALKLAQFRFFQLRQGNRRRTPVRWEVRLQDLFPEAMQQLRAKGTCDFTLMPEHLNHHFPGLYNVTVLKVQLKSGVTFSPVRWVLTNSSKGVVRELDGSTSVHNQTVEARLNSFSSDVFAEGMLQDRVAQNQLEPFENTSPLCTWTLRYAGSSAATDLGSLTACNIVLDLDAEFSELLSDDDQQKTAARLLQSSRVTAITLGTIDDKARSELTSNGSASFIVPFAVPTSEGRQSLFPEGAAELKMTGLGLRLLSRRGVTKPLTGIKFELEVPCDPAGPVKRESLTLTADAAGAVDPGKVIFAQNVLPLGVFSIKLAHNDERLNDDGVLLADIEDLALAISYQVTKLRP